MSKTFPVWICGIAAASMMGSLSFAQTGVQNNDAKAAAASDIPKRDISGTWTPEIGAPASGV